MNQTQKIILTGALYAVAIGLGIWLSHSGRPLNVALTALHKICAVAAVAVTAYLFVGLLKGLRLETIMVFLLAASGVFIAALIATGAVLSGAKAPNPALLLVHGLCTALALLSLAGVVYIAAQ